MFRTCPNVLLIHLLVVHANRNTAPPREPSTRNIKSTVDELLTFQKQTNSFIPTGEQMLVQTGRCTNSTNETLDNSANANVGTNSGTQRSSNSAHANALLIVQSKCSL